MRTHIGEVEGLYRYPVKSMRGESLAVAQVGWHGIAGDRRLALHRVDDRGGFPWLTASRLPELVCYSPLRRTPSDAELPSNVRTPAGTELTLFGDELAAEVSARHGAPVAMVHLNRGIFDEASMSLIAHATVEQIGRASSQPPDVRRFRPNVALRTLDARPFIEEDWVGGVLTFGDAPDAAAVAVTNRDVRCAMVNIHPDSARIDAEVLKAIVRLRANTAGVYATVTRCGSLVVGQPVFFEPSTM
ncbi:MAG: MOSC domain-containing protein [Gemmatimonadaceae bacterium]|jgi:hypothetical protein|nr:MOSC domain-containing protein [Gemmatimonadaceae bacterium]